MSKKQKSSNGVITPQQFMQLFGYEIGAMQRLIKLGMPTAGDGKKKEFNLIEVANWLRTHWAVGYMSLQEVADMFGVEVRTVTKFVNELGMPKVVSGWYKRNDIVQWRLKHLEKKIKELQQGGSDGVSASTKLKSAQARRQELRYAKEAGKLVELDKVLPVFEKLFSLIAQRRKLFSKRTNPQLDGIDSFGEREKILTESIDELFNDIYESGIRELTRLRELSGADQDIAQNNAPAAPAARKRVGKKVSRPQRRNRKRTRKV
jgi:phage terminase Nu1 subunit (DNA packaging protein)